jgi:AMMECR1 domain-containing protein
VLFNVAPKEYIKSGLLLPDLEGINTIEEQIFIACQKAGINPKKEKISIFKFTAKKYQ